MVTKIIWHVGCPKTGSSHLQRVLCHNHDKLLKADFFYQTDGGANHREMFKMLAASNSEVDMRNVARTWLGRLLQEADGKTLIISDEAFANCKTPIVEVLANEYGTNSTVIQFVRSPASFSESAWKQWHGGSGKWNSFEEYLSNWFHPNWSKNMELWAKGGASLVVHPYVPKKYSIVQMFEDTLGIKSGFSESYERNDGWGENFSLNKKGTILQEKLYRRGVFREHEIKKILNTFAGDLFFKGVGGGFSLMSLAAVVEYNERYRVLIEKVERISGKEIFSELNDSDVVSFQDNYDGLDEVVLDDDIVTLLARIISAKNIS